MLALFCSLTKAANALFSTRVVRTVRSIPLLQDEKPTAGVTLPLTGQRNPPDITSVLFFRDFKSHLLFAVFGAKCRIAARFKIHCESAGLTGLNLAE